jgi:hypothetical protein
LSTNKSLDDSVTCQHSHRRAPSSLSPSALFASTRATYSFDCWSIQRRDQPSRFPRAGCLIAFRLPSDTQTASSPGIVAAGAVGSLLHRQASIAILLSEGLLEYCLAPCLFPRDPGAPCPATTAEARTGTRPLGAAVLPKSNPSATNPWQELDTMNVGNPHPLSQRPSRTLMSIQRAFLCRQRAPIPTPDTTAAANTA